MAKYAHLFLSNCLRVKPIAKILLLLITMTTKKVNILTSLNPRIEQLQNVIGERGERIFYLAITDFRSFSGPIFSASHLGEKWPTVDFYVELLKVRKSSPFFLAQVKTTAKPLRKNARVLSINVEKKKCERLFRIPGPTYIFGIHEPTQKAYVLSIHSKPYKGIYRIPLKYELTPENLNLLYREVREFWQSTPHKPSGSHFI